MPRRTTFRRRRLPLPTSRSADDVADPRGTDNFSTSPPGVDGEARGDDARARTLSAPWSAASASTVTRRRRGSTSRSASRGPFRLSLPVRRSTGSRPGRRRSCSATASSRCSSTTRGKRHGAPPGDRCGRSRPTYYWTQVFAGREAAQRRAHLHAQSRRLGRRNGRHAVDGCGDAELLPNAVLRRAGLHRRRTGAEQRFYRGMDLVCTDDGATNWSKPIGSFTLTVDKGAADRPRELLRRGREKDRSDDLPHDAAELTRRRPICTS